MKNKVEPAERRSSAEGLSQNARGAPLRRHTATRGTRSSASPPPLPSSPKAASSISWFRDLPRHIRSSPLLQGQDNQRNHAGYQPESHAAKDHERRRRYDHHGVMKVQIHDRCPITDGSMFKALSRAPSSPSTLLRRMDGARGRVRSTRAAISRQEAAFGSCATSGSIGLVMGRVGHRGHRACSPERAGLLMFLITLLFSGARPAARRASSSRGVLALECLRLASLRAGSRSARARASAFAASASSSSHGTPSRSLARAGGRFRDQQRDHCWGRAVLGVRET